MVRAVVGGVNHPVRDSHQKVAGEGYINMGLAGGSLKRGDVAHVLGMKSVAKEEVLKSRAPQILIRAIDSTVGIGVHCQKNPRRVVVSIVEEVVEPGGVNREVDVQVDAGDDITSTTVKEHNSTVPVAKMGNLLGLKEARGIYSST